MVMSLFTKKTRSCFEIGAQPQKSASCSSQDVSVVMVIYVDSTGCAVLCKVAKLYGGSSCGISHSTHHSLLVPLKRRHCNNRLTQLMH